MLKIKRVLFFLFILSILITGCKKREGTTQPPPEPRPNVHYDYLLLSYEDIIVPPSGNSGNWIYIIGGDINGTYYVSPNGNDSNPGTRERPFKSIAYGVSRLSPGDTLVILPGGTNRRPVIAGGNALNCAFDLSGKSYIWIENIEITHNDTMRGEGKFFWDGIYIWEPANNIVVKNVYIHHIDGMGMNIRDVNFLEISGCRIEYCGFGGLGGPEPSQGGWQNVTIKGCTLSYSGHYYQGKDSCDVYDRPDGFGIETSLGPILIENTVAMHNYGDGLDSKAYNTTVKECIVANNSGDGVKLWKGTSRIINTLIYGRGDRNTTPTPWAAIVIDQGDEGEPNQRFEIINCTIDDTLGNNYLMYVEYGQTRPQTIVLINNIFCGRGPECPIYINEASTIIAENNLFYFPRSPFVLEHGNTVYDSTNIHDLGPGNIYGNPLFVRTAWGIEGDYHLRNGSPAIDAGTSNLAPSIDLDGRPRPQGNNFDIGCYER
ncbi:MAG: right-handed parallel beta-helix repeat-containing protein [Thermoplasmata archaeon]